MLKFLVKNQEVLKAEEEKVLMQELGLTRQELKENGLEILSPQEFSQLNMRTYEDENPFADW